MARELTSDVTAETTVELESPMLFRHNGMSERAPLSLFAPASRRVAFPIEEAFVAFDFVVAVVPVPPGALAFVLVLEVFGGLGGSIDVFEALVFVDAFFFDVTADAGALLRSKSSLGFDFLLGG